MTHAQNMKTMETSSLIDFIKSTKEARDKLSHTIRSAQDELKSRVFSYEDIRYAVTEDGIFVELISDAPWHKSEYSKILNIHGLDAFAVDDVISFLQAYANHLHGRTP